MKSSFWEAIISGQTHCLDDPRLLQNESWQWSHVGFEMFIECSSKQRPRSSFRHTVGRSNVSSHWQHIGESVQDANLRSCRLECVWQVYTQEATFGDKKYDWQIEGDWPKTSWTENQGFSFPSEICNRSSEQRKGERRKELAYVGPWKANVHSEIRAKSSMNQTREAKRMYAFVQFLRQAQQAHQILLITVFQDK